MAKIRLTESLGGEYRRLFETCALRPDVMGEVERRVDRIEGARARYESVAANARPPWHVIGVLHSMESDLRFDRHLHNGDPLTARTVHEPARRPRDGEPPFTWEASAADAMSLGGLTGWKDYSVAGTLYRIEAYNGFGCRLYHPQVLTPYLWSGSYHYSRGKYVADGTWSDSAVSRQIGAAVLLRRMAERGLARFDDASEDDAPRVRYAPRVVSEAAMELQRWLNTHAGVFVKVDGKAGPRTSDAFRRVTGNYLEGDPRA